MPENEIIMDTTLGGFCDFWSGSVTQMRNLNYNNGLFDVDYSIGAQTYFRTLVVSMLHEFCVQRQIEPYAHIDLGTLLTYALHYDLHVTHMKAFLLPEEFREKLDTTIVKNRLFGLSGLMGDNFFVFWNATKANPDNPINQLLTLADHITDFLVALDSSTHGERLATMHLATIHHKLEQVPIRGSLNMVRIWFVEKFRQFAFGTVPDTSAVGDDQI